MKIEQIKNIIESAHINFLIGSGVSRPYLNTLGGIETWLTELSNNPSDDKIKVDLVKCSILNEYLVGVIIPNLEEVVVNHADILIKWEDRDLLEDDAKPTCDEKRAIAFDETIRQYQRLLQYFHTLLSHRRTNLKNKSINLFTTNIDMLVEYANNSLGVELNDGFTGRKPAIFDDGNFTKQATKVGLHLQKVSEIPTINYIKLHGSLNWAQGENRMVVADDTLQNVHKAKTSFAKIQSSLINVSELYDSYIVDGVEDTFTDFLLKNVNIPKEEDLKQLREQLLEAIEDYSKIIMVNPTKRKFRETVMDMPFYELMRLYSNSLERENSLMFVAGFSFADEHLSKLTLRAAANNPTLNIIIFAYDENSKDDIIKALKKQGRITNDNIIILSPKDYILSNNQDTPGKIEIKDIEKMTHFDLKAINNYVLDPLVQSI